MSFVQPAKPELYSPFAIVAREVTHSIFRELDPFTLLNMQLVCKELSEVSQDDSLWKAVCFQHQIEKQIEHKTWQEAAISAMKLAFCYADFQTGSVLNRMPSCSELDKSLSPIHFFAGIRARRMESVYRPAVHGDKIQLIGEASNRHGVPVIDVDVCGTDCISFDEEHSVQVFDLLTKEVIFGKEGIDRELGGTVTRMARQGNRLAFSHKPWELSKSEIDIHFIESPNRGYTILMDGGVQALALQENVLAVSTVARDESTGKSNRIHLIDIENQTIRRDVYVSPNFLGTLLWDGFILYVEEKISEKTLKAFDFSKKASQKFTDQPQPLLIKAEPSTSKTSIE